MGIVLISISYMAAIAFFSVPQTGKETFRSAFIKASVVHALIIAILTELLSINQNLNVISISFSWGLLAAVNFYLLRQKIFKAGLKVNFAQIYLFVRGSFSSQTLINKIIIVSTIAVSAVGLIISLSAPPNNYDSMTYHMPRIMHWIQNQSVGHYPTHNLRQVSFPPGVGYIILHLQLLAGGDYLANIVQWLAFVGCVLGISLIAKKIIGLEAQCIAALICASIPMAIMQSATTQTDLTASFWLVCFAYFVFENEDHRWRNLFWPAASLGLAVLAKPTGIIYGAPLLAILGYRTLRALPGRGWSLSVLFSMLYTGSIATLATTLSLPGYLRNFATFGKLLGTDNGTVVTRLGLSVFLSNLLRNIALNIPFKTFWDLIEKIHHLFLSVDVNDPVSTFSRCSFDQNYILRLIAPDEDFVGSLIHMVLVFVAYAGLFVVALYRPKKIPDALFQLAAACLAGFGLYCTLIKWQIWANRLMLPFFILSALVCAFFIVRFTPKGLQYTLSIMLASSALFYALTPIHRPIIPLRSEYILFSLQDSIFRLNRDEIYFRIHNTESRSVYAQLADYALKKNCRNIGLEIGNDDIEYLIWMALKLRGIEPLRIKHVNVRNQTENATPEFQDADMCMIIKKQGGYFEIWTVKR